MINSRQTKIIYMKYYANIYSRRVLEKIKHMNIRAFLTYKYLGKYSKKIYKFAVPITIKL